MRAWVSPSVSKVISRLLWKEPGDHNDSEETGWRHVFISVRKLDCVIGSRDIEFLMKERIFHLTSARRTSTLRTKRVTGGSRGFYAQF